MELSEFIFDTLIQVREGITRANDKVDDGTRPYSIGLTEGTSIISFVVGICITESEGKGRVLSVSASHVGFKGEAGADSKSYLEQQSDAKLSFNINCNTIC